jgi:4-hydroxybenzoyl-CoA reductase subunit beta
MHLDPFELHRPETLEEAVRLAREHANAFDFLAGGTDLLPNYKMHLNVRAHLIALDRIPELSGHSDGRLGAMTRLSALESDPEFGRQYPGVLEAIREVATPLVRASGTLGGNLLVETRCFFFNQSHLWRESLGYCLKAEGDRCHVVPQTERCYATFSGDLAPALMVLDAEVELAGASGPRTVPLAELYDAQGDGIRRTRLRPGEIVAAVRIPKGSRGRAAAYRKLRIRPSFDFPELGVAAALEMDGERLRSLALAAGGLESYPRRFDELTEGLLGEVPSADRLGELGAAVSKAVRPVHNTFLDPSYRRKMAGVYVRRTIEAALARARAPHPEAS